MVQRVPSTFGLPSSMSPISIFQPDPIYLKNGGDGCPDLDRVFSLPGYAFNRIKEKLAFGSLCRGDYFRHFYPSLAGGRKEDL